MIAFLALFFGTFVSEDLACITAGVLIQHGEIGVGTGVVGCAAGIFVGDFGLWAMGRLFGRAALSWPWLARKYRAVKWEHRWIARHAAGVIVGSRFLPGTRVPLYVAAGALRLPAAVFALWALVASALWTPTIVLLTAALGDAFTLRVIGIAGFGWSARIACIVLALVALTVARRLASDPRRRRIAARFARWSRWEFWPMWLFYAPVAAWVGFLALRHGGLGTMTAANPGMPDGGTVGESKADILAKLPARWTIPFAVFQTGPTDDRVAALERVQAERGWTYPLILKPDVGERGAGVRLARRSEDVRGYFDAEAGPVVAQPYHPGPFEAGVFYYRVPGSPNGCILSITDKKFPFVVGDGVSTLEQLIWRHPRYRLQADTFLARHRPRLEEVPNPGQAVQLAIAGNHAQGTLFCDGAHLLTPALERRIDEIAKSFPGFYVGRFDIRYTDEDAFKAGNDLAIVELNGATSESTNIYDPARSLFAAYRTLFRQWEIVFAIGAENRRRGERTTPLSRLVGLVAAHWRRRIAFELAD